MENGEIELFTFEGTLTKRERFAMAAMQGLCANPQLAEAPEDALARYARKQADAMIAELDAFPEPL